MAQADKTDWSFWQKWIALDLLLDAGELMVHSAPVAETNVVLTEALQLAAEIKEKLQQALAGYLSGVTQQLSGDSEGAATLYAEALSIEREIGRRDGEAACLKGLADVAQQRGDFERAELLYRQSLALFTELGMLREQVIVTKALAALAKLRESAE